MAIEDDVSQPQQKNHIRPDCPDIVEDKNNYATPDADSEKSKKNKYFLNKCKNNVAFAQDEESDKYNDDDDDAKADFLNVDHFVFFQYDRGP